MLVAAERAYFLFGPFLVFHSRLHKKKSKQMKAYMRSIGPLISILTFAHDARAAEARYRRLVRLRVRGRPVDDRVNLAV